VLVPYYHHWLSQSFLQVQYSRQIYTTLGMPTPPPRRGWATLQRQVLEEVRRFHLGRLSHVKEVSVANQAGEVRIEHRPEPLAYRMAEESTNTSSRDNQLEAEAEREREKLMAMRKALEKVRMRTEMDRELYKVDDRLFISASGGAKNLQSLTDAGITHIVNAAPVVPCFFKEKGSFQYLHLDLYDTSEADISQHFEPVSDFISDALAGGGAVLVHCYAGQSRSASLLAAHLMLKHNLPLGKALSQLQAARPSVCPNVGFLRHLKALEAKLQAPPVAGHAKGMQQQQQPHQKVVCLSLDAPTELQESLKTSTAATTRDEEAPSLPPSLLLKPHNNAHALRWPDPPATAAFLPLQRERGRKAPAADGTHVTPPPAAGKVWPPCSVP